MAYTWVSGRTAASQRLSADGGRSCACSFAARDGRDLSEEYKGAEIAASILELNELECC
jgi:hypothetical protein